MIDLNLPELVIDFVLKTLQLDQAHHVVDTVKSQLLGVHGGQLITTTLPQNLVFLGLLHLFGLHCRQDLTGLVSCSFVLPISRLKKGLVRFSQIFLDKLVVDLPSRVKLVINLINHILKRAFVIEGLEFLKKIELVDAPLNLG